MRFIAPLSIFQEQELRRYLSSSDVKLLPRERKRFSSICLSSKHNFTIKELSAQFDVSENSIKSWFDRYESMGCLGLLDKNMAHSQSSLATENAEIILEAVKQTPQNLKRTVVLLKEEHQIETNPSILKRFLKKKSGVGEEYKNR
jgi:transposase